MTAYQPLPRDQETSTEGEALSDEDYDSGHFEAELAEGLGRALIVAILEFAPIEDVHKLLDEDVPLWYQDEGGWSALHAAASVEDAELVKSLLQKGALWNAGKARSLTCSCRTCETHI
jgi:type IV protein arginine methyltransferase